MKSDLLVPIEVAKLFGVDSATVNRWANAGKLPYFRTPGNRLRFRIADVRVLLLATNSALPPFPPVERGTGSAASPPG